MVFQINGPGSTVVIADEHEKIFFELPRQFELTTPQCDFLWEAFYRNPRLTSPAQVTQLKAEIAAIRVAYEKARKAQLTREKKIRGPSSVVSQILDDLLAGDQIIRKCDEIIRACDEAVAAGHGLSCSSD